MQTLRHAKQLARFVLVWFALSIGVAIASPLVKPQEMQLICSGQGVMKVIVVGDDGQTPSGSHTLDCPLCASVSAPAPIAVVASGSAPAKTYLQPSKRSGSALFALVAPPPARGPPSFI